MADGSLRGTAVTLDGLLHNEGGRETKGGTKKERQKERQKVSPSDERRSLRARRQIDEPRFVVASEGQPIHLVDCTMIAGHFGANVRHRAPGTHLRTDDDLRRTIEAENLWQKIGPQQIRTPFSVETVIFGPRFLAFRSFRWATKDGTTDCTDKSAAVSVSSVLSVVLLVLLRPKAALCPLSLCGSIRLASAIRKCHPAGPSGWRWMSFSEKSNRG